MIMRKSLCTFCLLVFGIIMVISPRIVSAGGYGDTVLCLYKSSDGYAADSNPIKWFFEPHITSFALKARYFDLESGIPVSGDLKNVRAILTWYNNSVVKDLKTAKEYIDFLCRASDSGIKIIIVNSFGVYGYREGAETRWLESAMYNPLFNRLGFSFAGCWTDTASRLRIVYENPDVAGQGGKQDAALSKHYQRIVPLVMRPDVQSHLIIRSTDVRKDYEKCLGDGRSSVILTSKNGGFALEQYVIRGRTLLLNPQSFLKKSLFYSDGFQRVGIVVGNLKDRQAVVGNITRAFSYAKVEYEFISEDDLKFALPGDLGSYTAVMIASRSLDGYPRESLEKYVRDGGNLIFLRFCSMDDGFMKLAGIRKYGEETFFREGFDVEGGFFINNYRSTGEDVGLRVRKADLADARVIARVRFEFSRGEYPVAWVRSLGGGKILYWNTDILLASRLFRGTIVQSVHFVSGGFVTGLANIGMMMIDDLPAPWWNLNYKKHLLKIYTEKLRETTDSREAGKLEAYIRNLQKYPDVTDTDFVRETWIKDITNMGKRIGFRYTAFLIYNYNLDTGLDNKEPVIRDFYLSRDGLSLAIGKLVLDSGWELGFHGFNHQSLTLTKPEFYNSKPWKDKAAMEKALRLSEQEWERDFGAYSLPYTYVPPHNIIDNTGLAALGETFPSIRVVGALYQAEEGEREQEFGWGDNYRFYYIPRITSGYDMKDLTKRGIYDVMHNFGVISHFIHPDDPFTIDRSSNYAGWDYLKNRFTSDFSEVKSNFPWLRWMTVKDACGEFQFYESTNIRVKRDGNVIEVYSSGGSERYLYFRLRFDPGRKVKQMVNCVLVNEHRQSGDFVFKTNTHYSKIVFL